MQENMTHEWKVWTPKKRSLSTLQALAWIITILLSITMACIGIGWLASVALIVSATTVLGHPLFLSIPPGVLALLVTSILYLAFWPLSLVTKAFRSVAEGRNRFITHHVVWGAIAFALAIASTAIIAISVGWMVSFDYHAKSTRIIIDHGAICISESDACAR